MLTEKSRILGGDIEATPHKARLTTLYVINLHFFRHSAQKLLVIRQYYCVIFMHSDEKSDCVSAAQSLCGVAIEFFFPVSGSFEEGNDVFVIGTVIGDGKEILLSRETGEFFTSLDGETEEYEDFDDLLTGLSGFPEDSAEEALGEEWGDIYDERFGE